MAVEITMPQLSDTMTEGTVVRWVKKEGQQVKGGEVIAEVETDKATMEMEAFEGGTIAVVLIPEGGKVPVGGTIAVLATGKETVEQVKKQYGSKSAGGNAMPVAQTASEPKAAKELHGGSVSNTTATLEEASNSEVHDLTDNQHGATRENISTEPPHGGNGDAGGRIRVSPLAKRIAKEQGVDLSGLRGSGPGGRIVQSDVLAAAQNGGAAGAKPQAAPVEAKPAAAKAGEAAPQLAPRVGSGEKQVIPLTKMRTAIATALQRSKQQVPHFYVTVDVDMEEVTSLRERLNATLEKQKVKLSVGDFITKAVAMALVQHPGLNATFNAEKQEITRYGDVNLGIAVALPEGLIVPVLRNASQMGLKEIRQRSTDLAERARAQRLKREELSGATFTISNLGMYGVKEFNAIINPPEVGILAVSAAEKRAVVRGGQIVARATMSLTLSCDHRAVDGATGAEFLRTVKNLLEDPGMMLV